MHIADFVANSHRFQVSTLARCLHQAGRCSPSHWQLGTHWQSAAARAEAHARLPACLPRLLRRAQNEAILLIHFSSRYKRAEILAHLNTWLPPALKAKVVPLLNGFSD